MIMFSFSPAILTGMAVFSAVTFIASLIIVPIILARLPSNYFLAKKSNEIEVLNQKVKKAFDNAENLEAKHSKWYNRNEKLPLTIIAVAYINPKVKKTKEFYAYKKLIKKRKSCNRRI